MPGYDTCLVEAELRARSAYAEPHRRYHTERHLDDCLRQLEQVLELPEPGRRRLRWAILWHDAVYDPARSDNEERSADLACRELTACGVDEDTSGEVRRLILLTKGHRADETASERCWYRSIDRSILGSDEARYREYVSGVRQEYAHVLEDAWRTGRAAVLRHLLDADPLYPDPTFRDRLEAQARRNMEQELKALGAG